MSTRRKVQSVRERAAARAASLVQAASPFNLEDHSAGNDTSNDPPQDDAVLSHLADGLSDGKFGVLDSVNKNEESAATIRQTIEAIDAAVERAHSDLSVNADFLSALDDDANVSNGQEEEEPPPPPPLIEEETQPVTTRFRRVVSIDSPQVRLHHEAHL